MQLNISLRKFKVTKSKDNVEVTLIAPATVAGVDKKKGDKVTITKNQAATYAKHNLIELEKGNE